MPAFGAQADELIQALAEGDGELITESDPPITVADDPTLGTLHGPRLAGFQGYACASCHVWNGNLLGSPDPVATGPDLTRTAGRIRRDWFDRYVESPLRFYPGTPMPAIFPHGKPATLANILDGNASQQKDAPLGLLREGEGLQPRSRRRQCRWMRATESPVDRTDSHASPWWQRSSRSASSPQTITCSCMTFRQCPAAHFVSAARCAMFGGPRSPVSCGW